MKETDPTFARQNKALAKLCKEHSVMGFTCNPAGALVLDEQERLFYMGSRVLDSQIMALRITAMMLTSNELLKGHGMVSRYSNFSHAVLVRLATQTERDEQEEALSVGPEDHLGCLELVWFTSDREGITWFRRSGHKEFYIH